MKGESGAHHPAEREVPERQVHPRATRRVHRGHDETTKERRSLPRTNRPTVLQLRLREEAQAALTVEGHALAERMTLCVERG